MPGGVKEKRKENQIRHHFSGDTVIVVFGKRIGVS